MRLPRFAWRNTERPAALGPRGAKVPSVLVDLDPLAICKGHMVRFFDRLGMVRMLIHHGRLFTMFIPPLPTFNGARECGKRTSTKGRQFLSRS